MKALTIIFCILLTVSLNAQDEQPKSLSQEGYKMWTMSKPALRVGIGIQKALYTELGLAMHKYMYNDLGYASSTYYTAFEWTPLIGSEADPLYAAKLGYEVNARTLALGIECKFQSDTNDNDFFITPKIGLGAFGLINLFYGYNISTAGNVFDKVGNNQFSLVVNLYRLGFRRGIESGQMK